MTKPASTNKRASRFYDYQYISMPPAYTGKRLARSTSSSRLVTPIPARASAFPSTMVKPRARAVRSSTPPRQQVVVHPVPEQMAMPRRERSTRELSPHLSARVAPLAPFIDEIATLPPSLSARDNVPPTSQAQVGGEPLDPAELDTRPPTDVPQPLSEQAGSPDSQADIAAELPTTPLPLSPARELSPVQEMLAAHDTMAIWHAPTLSAKARRRKRGNAGFHPLDYLRWWLIRPGHLEFLFWLGGTLLLLCLSSIFVFAFAMNMGTSGISQRAAGPSPLKNAGPLSCESSNQSSDPHTCTLASPDGLRVTLEGGAAPNAGSVLSLRGQGFSARGRVLFIWDGSRPCEPASVQSDGQGVFAITLDFTDEHRWLPGRHQITIVDEVSKRSLLFVLTLTHKVAPTPTPTATISATPTPDTSYPGSEAGNTYETPTSVPVQQGPTAPSSSSSGSDGPVSSPPAARPTAGITPSPVGTAPTPTLPGVTPTARTQQETAALPLNTFGAIWQASPVGSLLLSSYSVAALLLGIALLLILCHRTRRTSRFHIND